MVLEMVIKVEEKIKLPNYELSTTGGGTAAAAARATAPQQWNRKRRKPLSR